MTIDSLMIQPERYKSLLQEQVFREGIEVYERLGYSKSSSPVSKEELWGFVYSDIYSDVRDQLVHEAVEREDYKLFGMTKEEFITKTYSGQFEDAAVNPYIRHEEFTEAAQLFVTTYQLMVIGMDGEVENCSLQEVW